MATPYKPDVPDMRGAANAVAARVDSPLATLSKFLKAQSNALSTVITRGLNPARMIDLVCLAASRQPELAQCTPLSIYAALKSCAALGIEPCTPQKHAYLVPFKNNKTRTTEAMLIVGYVGLCELALREGRVKGVRAQVVYRTDRCKISIEPPKVEHEWQWDIERDDREIIGAYAVAELTSGSQVVAAMTKSQIDAVRRRSKARGDAREDGSLPAVPWNTDYPAMARKTVIRRLLSGGSVPMSSELSQAFETEDDESAERVRPAMARVVEDLAPEPYPEESEPAADVRMRSETSDKASEWAEGKAEGGDGGIIRPGQAARPAVDIVEDLLALATRAGVGVDQCCAVAQHIAGKSVIGLEQLRAVDPVVLAQVYDRLKAKLEAVEERRGLDE